MKKQILKKIMWMLMVLLLGATSLTGCKKEQVEEEKKPQQEEKATYVQLLGFDSYEEFTGARISIGNMLGKMDINTDKEYITQGKGSLEVNPQGNYDKVRKHPYFKLDFLNTTCATCDFSEFKNVSFDIYNPSEEMKQVRVSLSVGKDDGVYTTTIKSIYDLEPKSWTTCVYDISEMAGFTYYDFANVRYMTVEFMDHKENRDDAVEPLYVDNLVGNYYAEGESAANVTYDFWEGITFEESTDQYLVFGDDVEVNKVELSRADYEKEGIQVPDSLGKYGLKADATESIWPKFSIRLGEKVPADTAFSFMAYIKVDAKEEDTFSFESYSVFGGNSVANEITISDTVFNDWVEVTVRTSIETDVISGFFNFDDFSDPVTGHTRFGDKEVLIYLDNMKLAPYVDPMSLAPANPDWIKGLTFEKDGEQYLITNENDAANQKMKLSRVAWAEEGMKVGSEFGQYGMKGKVKGAAYPEMTINYRKTMPADTIITFKAYIKTDSAKTYYKADGSKVTTVKTESFGNVDLTGQIPLNEWVDIKIRLSKAQDTTRMFFNFDNGKDTTCFGKDEVLIYFDNIRVDVPIQPEGDFLKGIGFEVPGNAGLFTPQNKEGQEYMDAMIERVAYSQAGITAPQNGEEHALKISHKSFFWPRFRMNFGTTLPAGTKITFMAYGKVNGDTLYNMSLFEYTSGGEATAQFALEEWTELSVVLKEEAKYLDLFWNYDRAGGLKEGTSGEVYIDNVIATLPIQKVGNIYEGIGFEVSGNEAFFIGQGNIEHDATIKRETYQSLGIKAPENGGAYGLKLGHSSFFWPTFRIDFGEKLEAGTKLTFMAYGKINGDSLYNQSIFEFSEGGEATPQFKCGAWTELTITLKEAAEYVDLYWNYDRAGGLKEGTSAEVYIDNIIAVKPTPKVEPVGDILEGYGFEVVGNEANFTGQTIEGSEWMDATIERVDYASEGITAPVDGEEHALKLSHASFYWPKFRINFGKELPVGTEITFTALGKINGEYLYNAAKGGQSKFEIESGNAKITGGHIDEYGQFTHEDWKQITMTLTAACEYVDLFWNYECANIQSATASGEVYIDNIKATEPVVAPTPVGDIVEGYGFEVEGNELYFVGQGIVGRDMDIQRADYASTSVSAATNGGSYVLKMATTSDNKYPTFRINFGKELAAGTEITFQAHGKITSGEYLYSADKGGQSAFEITSGNATVSGDLDQYGQFTHEGWKNITLTLSQASTGIDLFWNFARANFTGGDEAPSSGELYIDNIKATEPVVAPTPVGDIVEGYGFEVEGNELYFAGQNIEGSEWMDATIERVDYATVGVAAPTDGGSYALKLSHDSFYWPKFRINFGKELPVGTEITFTTLGKITSGEYLYNVANGGQSKFEITSGNASITGGDIDQYQQFTHEGWKQITMTLTAACEYVDLFWNYECANIQSATASGEVYIDNIKATEPVVVPTPVGDIVEGYGFEVEGNELYFVGQGIVGRDMDIQRADYASTSVSAATNGGSYVLKMATTSDNKYPTFRINFGKELAAGTEITFQAHGKITSGEYLYSADKGGQSAFEITSGNATVSGDLDQYGQFTHEGWKNITLTLSQASTGIDLFWNFARANFTGGDEAPSSGELYIDNIKATEPVVAPTPVGDIVEGYGFEVEGNELYFAGQNIEGSEWMDATIERVDYATVGVAAPTDGGSYALKLSHDSFYWPKFRINFGKELPVGTEITFTTLGKITSGEYLYNVANGGQSKFEITSGNASITGGDIDQYQQFTHEGWKQITMTLTAACEYVDLFWNYECANIQSATASGEVYIDNIKATEPVADDNTFIEGLDFEEEADAAYFVGQNKVGEEYRDATIERVDYASAGITAPTNGGSYGLRLSHATNYWPTFRINFGKTLPAGTVIRFQVLGKITSGEYLYNVAKGGQSKFEIPSGSATITGGDIDAYQQFTHESWKNLNITLTTACEYLDMFWNYECANIQSTTASGEVYVDNVIALEPGQSTGFTAGLSFEEASDEAYIIGQGVANDATIERVTYESAGISAPTDGGNYALKMSTANDKRWPTFRMEFGEQLPAGTKISFQVKGNISGTYQYNVGKGGQSKFEITSGNATVTGGDIDSYQQITHEGWKNVTITLSQAATRVDLFWNIDVASYTANDAAGEVYIDNVVATKPN